MTYRTDDKIRYVKGYGFMSFAKNLGSKYGKKIMNKGISASKKIKDSTSKFNQSKYGKALKKEGSKFLKTSVQKASPAVGDYIGSKIADKLTSSLRLSQNQEPEEQEIIIPPDKRQQILNDLRLF